MPSQRLPFTSSSTAQVDGLDLLVRDNEVQVVVRLGARRQRIRRHAPVRRYDDADALAEQLGALHEREGRALEHHVRAMVVDVVARHVLHPAADALADPVVVVRTEEMAVAREQLLA